MRKIGTYFMFVVQEQKRLVFFVSVPIDSTFRSFLNEVIGLENIYTYNQYLDLEIS